MVDPVLYTFPLSAEQPFHLAVDIKKRAGGRTDHPPDMHYAVHIGIVLQGRMRIRQPGVDHWLQEGQVWLTACWEPHWGVRCRQGAQIMLCTLLPERIGELGIAQDVDWLAPFLAPVATRPCGRTQDTRNRVLAIADALFALSTQQTAATACLTWLKMHELLLQLIIDEPGPSHQRSLGQRVQPAIDRIRRARGRPVGLEEAALACQLRKSRFSDLFRQLTGVSFGRFETDARLAGAVDDIRRSSASIVTIAQRWGFCDASHFGRAFRHRFGCTPGHYRQHPEVGQMANDWPG